SRFSSPMLKEALSSALMGCGCDVLDAGVCPAPAMQFLVPRMGAAAGLLIGAGHHPANWNAIVPISDSGAYMNEVQTQSLLDIYHSRKFNSVGYESVGCETFIPESDIDAYMDNLCSILNVDLIASSGFSVILDLCNGSGSRFHAKLAKRLGIQEIPVNDEISGVLPHDPEPRPRIAFQVKSLMRHLNADAGFVFNSDISRVSVVTNDCETLSEEYTFPLAVQRMLSRGFGREQTIVTNSCTTRTLDDVAASKKAEVEKTRVGQSPVIDRMLEIGAAAAGDGSGSFAMADAGPAFDGFLAMGMILESMAANSATLSELAEALPKYHVRKLKVPCLSSHAYTLLRNLADHFPDADISEVDGLRFDWLDGWMHFRMAMTEPVIRVIMEWRSKEEADERALRVSGLLDRMALTSR
ncbi:MAG: hypothetical protein KAG97_11575, partial [Victivallales bacterium]|nr:hypothetical protein [Victivallales bacterium]